MNFEKIKNNPGLVRFSGIFLTCILFFLIWQAPTQIFATPDNQCITDYRDVSSQVRDIVNSDSVRVGRPVLGGGSRNRQMVMRSVMAENQEYSVSGNVATILELPEVNGIFRPENRHMITWEFFLDDTFQDNFLALKTMVVTAYDLNIARNSLIDVFNATFAITKLNVEGISIRKGADLVEPNLRLTATYTIKHIHNNVQGTYGGLKAHFTVDNTSSKPRVTGVDFDDIHPNIVSAQEDIQEMLTKNSIPFVVEQVKAANFLLEVVAENIRLMEI